MADLTTAVQKVVRSLGLDSTTTGNQAETDAKIALIDSMNYNKKFAFWFNKATSVIVTEANDLRYPLPEDFVSMTEDPIYSADSTDSSSRIRLEYRPLNWCEEYKWTGANVDNTLNTGTPRYYSIDESANELLLVPVPATSAEQVSFHYLRDCEIPDYKYASSTWSFYVKGTNTALPATYTNDWLKNALDLIVNRACYLMLGGTYGGDEGSQVRANMYMQKWADELNRLRGENARRASVAGVRRWLR